MTKNNGEGFNIIDANDNDLGRIIGKMRNGIVLFYASWCEHSKIALRLLPKLAKEHEKLVFIRVIISAEESSGERKIMSPKIKWLLNIDKYPQWGVFRDGITGIPIISGKNEEGQRKDVEELMKKMGI